MSYRAVFGLSSAWLRGIAGIVPFLTLATFLSGPVAAVPISGPATPGGQVSSLGAVADATRIELEIASSLGVVGTQFREAEFAGTVVPEPESLILMAVGLLALCVWARWSNR